MKHLTVIILKSAEFLNFKPSQNAAACLIASLNIAREPELCEDLDFDVLPSMQRNRFEETMRRSRESSQENEKVNQSQGPTGDGLF